MSERFSLKLVIYLYSNITKQQQEHFFKVSVMLKMLERFSLKLVIYLYSNIAKQQQEHFFKVSVMRITSIQYNSGKIYIYKVQFFFHRRILQRSYFSDFALRSMSNTVWCPKIGKH